MSHLVSCVVVELQIRMPLFFLVFFKAYFCMIPLDSLRLSTVSLPQESHMQYGVCFFKLVYLRGALNSDPRFWPTIPQWGSQLWPWDSSAPLFLLQHELKLAFCWEPCKRPPTTRPFTAYQCPIAHWVENLCSMVRQLWQDTKTSILSICDKINQSVNQSTFIGI